MYIYMQYTNVSVIWFCFEWSWMLKFPMNAVLPTYIEIVDLFFLMQLENNCDSNSSFHAFEYLHILLWLWLQLVVLIQVYNFALTQNCVRSNFKTKNALLKLHWFRCGFQQVDSYIISLYAWADGKRIFHLMNLMNIVLIGFTLVTGNAFVVDVTSQPPKWITGIFSLRGVSLCFMYASSTN